MKSNARIHLTAIAAVLGVALISMIVFGFMPGSQTIVARDVPCSVDSDCPVSATYNGATITRADGSQVCKSNGCQYTHCTANCDVQGPYGGPLCDVMVCPHELQGCGDGECRAIDGESQETCIADCGSGRKAAGDPCVADHECGEAAPYCVNGYCTWEVPPNRPSPETLDAEWVSVSVDKSTVKAGEQLEVIAKLKVNTAGYYFVEAGIHGAGPSTASIYRNPCNPGQRWYSAQENLYLQAGQTHDLRFKVWPESPGIYRSEPHVYWKTGGCGSPDNTDPSATRHYSGTLTVNMNELPDDSSTSTSIAPKPGKDCTGLDMDPYCDGSTLKTAAQCIEGSVVYQDIACPNGCVEEGLQALCKGDPCWDLNCDDGDPTTRDTCMAGVCKHTSTEKSWRDYLPYLLVGGALIVGGAYLVTMKGKRRKR